MVTFTGTSLVVTKAAGTIKVTLAAPAGMKAVAGTGKMLGRLLFSLTVMPPAKARPLRRTMILPLPPARILLWTLRELRYGFLIRMV